MAGLRPSLNIGAAPFEVGSSSSSSGNTNNDRSVEQLVLDLCNSDLRANAMLELSKVFESIDVDFWLPNTDAKRETIQDLAPLLWNSAGTIAALLQEILSIYPFMYPPTLTLEQSNRICNCLALLQCVASHQDTRRPFLNVHIPSYLYPFMRSTDQTRPFEYLRVQSLGVIAALVKVDETDVIRFLISTETIPICLRTMEMGSDLSKIVATFIVQKILLDDAGLEYICTGPERFFKVSRVLDTMVGALSQQPLPRLLKLIIRCYLRLSDNPRACDSLRSFLPETLRDATFSAYLNNDPTTREWLQQLHQNLQRPRVWMQPQSAGTFDHFRINRFFN